MAKSKLDAAVLQEAVDAVAREGSKTAAAAQLQIPYPTLQHRLRQAAQAGIKPREGLLDQDDPAQLRAALKRAQQEVAEAQAKLLTHKRIRSEIMKLHDEIATAETPKWTQRIKSRAGSPGVPALFLSDLHWGEVVDPSQIGGVNEYNIEIAHERIDACVNTAVHLLKIVSPSMDYPGIVLLLGGDMVSGNIHEELAMTNELNTMPTVLDLWKKLRSVVEFLANTFGRVFVPCVTGNHGRDTHKIYTKDRHHTSFDWLLYGFLAEAFAEDPRVTFLIPDGPDAYFRIYNHRYLLTHGDQFRGGDGMIGALGPIVRGDHKKRSRNGQIDRAYDTLVLGHWHQDIFLRRLIVNSSLKGYDEYAYSNNFGFEPPSQQLWITHPDHGITFRAPVYVDRKRKAPKTEWVSIPKGA